MTGSYDDELHRSRALRAMAGRHQRRLAYDTYRVEPDTPGVTRTSASVEVRRRCYYRPVVIPSLPARDDNFRRRRPPVYCFPGPYKTLPAFAPAVGATSKAQSPSPIQKPP